MNLSSLCPRMSLLFVIIIVTLVQILTSLSTLDEKYLTCIAPFQCGRMQNISYPFWGSNRPEYCGYPGLKLICNSDDYLPLISRDDCPEVFSDNCYFRVLNINDESKTLTVARTEYWKDICPQYYCPLSNTLNSTIFYYISDTRNMTLYYRCPPASGEILATLLPNQFNCGSNENTTDNYYFLWNASSVNDGLSISEIRTYFESRGRSVIIPVWESTARALETNPNSITLSEAINFGFGLRWYANNSLCDECVRSDGVCGYDNGTNGFTCYCPDHPYPFTCY